jgi:hypothetical protein
MFEKLETLYISQSGKCPSGCTYCFSSTKQDYTIEKLTKFWEWFQEKPSAKAFGFLGFDPVDFKTLMFLKQLSNPKNIKLRVDMNGCDFNNSVLRNIHIAFLDGLLDIPNIQLTIKVPTEELPLLKIVNDLPKENIIIKLIIRPDNFQNIQQELIQLVGDGFYQYSIAYTRI